MDKEGQPQEQRQASVTPTIQDFLHMGVMHNGIDQIAMVSTTTLRLYTCDFHAPSSFFSMLCIIYVMFRYSCPRYVSTWGSVCCTTGFGALQP